VSSHWCKNLTEYQAVAQSDGRRVVVWEALAKEYRKIPTKDQGSLLRWMEIWSGDLDCAISTQRFKSQDSFTDQKGRKVQIWAFKSYQSRMYGFVRKVENKETFFVTAIDPAKKDDDADPAVLKRAKVEAFRVLDVLGIR